jgi:glutathione S-transferase
MMEHYPRSIAMLRYVAKIGNAGLYPSDPAAALAVDEAMDICQDILTKCPQDPDVEIKKTKRQEYAAGKMKAYFALLAARLTATAGALLLGDSVSIADLSVYYIVDMVRSGNVDHIDGSYVDQWPALAAQGEALVATGILTKGK